MMVLPMRARLGNAATRWVFWATVLASVLFLARSTGATGEFRIRKVRNVGKSLFVYHDPVTPPSGSAVRMRLSRGGCQVDPQAAMVPVRSTEDRYAVLIVMDRGGTKTDGMGRYSAAVLGAVKAFLDEETRATRGDAYALVDSSGSGSTPRSLPPNEDMGALRSFLDTAPEPSGVGADVYGNAASGLNLLEQNPKPLRAAVIISDGRDPHAAGSDGPEMLIQRARERDVPVFSIVVDRSNENTSQDYKIKLSQARFQLKRVSTETSGAEVAAPKADANLQSAIFAGLQQFSKTLGSVMRTTCAMCGTAGTPGELQVQMVVDAGGTVAFQSGEGTRNKVSVVGVGGLPACACASDTECASGETCMKGQCGVLAHAPPEESEKLPWWPFAAGSGLVVLGALGLVFRSRRDKRRAATAEALRMAEVEQRRQQDARHEQERAELLARQNSLEDKMRADEAQRRAEIQRKEEDERAAQERARLAQEAADRILREQQRIVMFVLHVVQAPSGVPAKFDLRMGEHIVGRDEGVPVCLPIAAVSGHHAVLRVTPDRRIFVRDLNSSNGTQVNGNRLAPDHDKELKPGDEVKFSRHVTTKLVATDPSASPHRAETKLEER